MHAPFGSGSIRKPRPLVENTPRVDVYELLGMATAPLSVLAREARVLLSIGGQEAIAVELEHMPQTLGGVQTFFLCPNPDCRRRCHHLYWRNEQLWCRRCHGLRHRSEHCYSRLLPRAAKLRRKLDAPPGLLSPLPPRPRHNIAAARYDRLVHELALCETKIAAMLRDTIVRVRRRRDMP